MAQPPEERLRRWRLVLGGDEADGTGLGDSLERDDRSRDQALEVLYEQRADRTGGLARSSPRLARWLGDIRTYFPSSVVRVMQADALERLGLRQLLLEPELLGSVQPDIHLVSTLISLNRAIPEHSRETARTVVRSLTGALEARLGALTRQAVAGALRSAVRTRRPRPGDVDWGATIRANLRHYQPQLGTVVPERLVGFGRRGTRVEREVVLCIDQSASMAASVVYASVFGAVLASVRSLRTRLVAFDTSVVDLTDLATDPVDVLFGVQLGGGTDIGAALGYCAGLVSDPTRTVLVLISDLYEGGDRDEMLRQVTEMLGRGVVVIALLALADTGAPSFDHENAAALAQLGVPSFACTPDQFPGLMAAAISGGDIGAWAAAHDIVTRG